MLLTVVGTGSVNQCPYNGFPLFVRCTLRSVEKSFPTGQPSLSLQPTSDPRTPLCMPPSDTPLGLTRTEAILLFCGVCATALAVGALVMLHRLRKKDVGMNLYKLKPMKLRGPPRMGRNRELKMTSLESREQVEGAGKSGWA